MSELDKSQSARIDRILQGFAVADHLANPMRNQPVYTMCAWCKATRDNDGQWDGTVPIVANLVTHGICPACAAGIRAQKLKAA